MELAMSIAFFLLGGVVMYLYLMTMQVRDLTRTVQNLTRTVGGFKLLSPDQLANAINEAVECKLTGGPH